jgi:pilus assembly protein Flp/PilA
MATKKSGHCSQAKGSERSLERKSKMKKLMNIMRDESGATAIEYGLIAALIAVALITIVTTVGGDLIAVFTSVSTGLQATQ